MNNDIKISLSVELPGSQMLSKEECLKTIQKEFTVKQGKHKGKKYLKEIEVEDWDKMNTHSFFSAEDKQKGIKSERLIYHTRKCIPAKQHLNISREAYEAMIDSNACPEWEKNFIWRKMSKKQRLDSHMNRIAEEFGGKVIDYHIFED